ncbi:hypothetical protein EYZ11_013488 [Aspergillus tanneri]|uniref:Uncharacterized protein n=1 Tax=Aspergillus tanneri TaxID=1220188 RepID=A0A4S3IXJ5_9EURO|nr:hypothetical protein EYZ11_013488 [Aspergillus tanneri]
MASEARPFGWALRRNGSCLADLEVDCGITCHDALHAKPVCANSTWDLYINGDYFCCEQGTTAFAKDGGSDGCTPAQVTSNSSNTNIGAIAGGVVGGVVGTAIIAGLLGFLIRRSRRQQQSPKLQTQLKPMQLMQPWQRYQARAELDNNRVVELENTRGSQPQVELP